MEAMRGESNQNVYAEVRGIVDSAIIEHTKQVIGDEKRRADLCMADVHNALNKHDCVIVPKCIISPNGVEFQIETVPRQHKHEQAKGQLDAAQEGNKP